MLVSLNSVTLMDSLMSTRPDRQSYQMTEGGGTLATSPQDLLKAQIHYYKPTAE